MKKAVQYGAGNIGRGFIGQLFFQSGYETVFIDVNKELVEKLNCDHSYPIKIISEQYDKEILVENVYAVDGLDLEGVAAEIASADIMATAVGVNVLPRIVKPIIGGLKKRWSEGNFEPLNIIICENLINADHFLADLIMKELSEQEKSFFKEKIGLVEASIGRMVPVMTPEMQEGNILRVYVEEYCQLPVDKDAFKGEIPAIVNMIPFSPFKYFIQRKLFIHNMGHAITAYLGYLRNYSYIWEANKDPYIKLISLRAMQESAKGLSAEHGEPLQEIIDHIDDLLYRFGNKLLGDSIERVGKDPVRKVSSNDRFIGAAKLCLSKGILPVYICLGVAAGLFFNMEGDQNAERIQQMISTYGPEKVLKEICGISEEEAMWTEILDFYWYLRSGISLDLILDYAERKVNHRSRAII